MRVPILIASSLTLLLMLTRNQVQAAILQVPQQYATIQAGINAAVTGDTVVLADGTYSGPGNVNLNYQGKAITVVSQSGPESCSILITGDDYGILFESGETPESVCEGLTFRSQPSSSNTAAVVISCVNASPTIRYCTIELQPSAGTSTTGLKLEGSSAVVGNCTIKDRPGGVAGVRLMGIAATNSSPTVQSCTISGTGVSGISQGIVLTTCTAHVSDTIIYNCHAQMGTDFGGGLASQNSNLTLQTCVINNCSAYQGGGLWIKQGVASLNETQVFSNSACTGAGIGIEDSEVLIDDGAINGNILTVYSGCNGYGSGVYCTGASTLIIRGTTIAFNCLRDCASTSPLAGIGVYCSAPDLVIADCTITDNQPERNNYAEQYFPSNDGGGVFCSSATISRTTFADNQAQRGGAIYGVTATIEQCTFTGNLATFGGAIAVTSTQCAIDRSLFTDNKAIVGSHCVALSLPATILVSNCFFSGVESDYYLAPVAAFEFETTMFERLPITQDVYVAPTGDDANSGLSPDTPFRTLSYALGAVAGSAARPIVVHVAAGRYAATDQAENFPLTITSYVTLSGAAPDETLLSGEFKYPVGFSYAAPHSRLQGLTIMNSANSKWGAFNCIASAPHLERCLITDSRWGIPGLPIYGGNWGLLCLDSSPVIKECIFTNNAYYDDSGDGGPNGGALACLGESSPMISGCIIAANTAEYGGGLYCEGTGSPVIHDSLFYANSSKRGGAALFFEGQGILSISNSLFIQNQGPDKGLCLNAEAFIAGSTFDATSIHCASSAITIIDSILWSRQSSNQALTVGQSLTPNITYCDVKDGYDGQGNLDRDPLFTVGPWGSHYLSAEVAGQSATSPCLDAGSQAAAQACYEGSDSLVCCDSLTVTTNQTTDQGLLDLGYHSWPTAAAEISVELHLPFRVFRPGDQFVLRLTLTNDTEATLTAIPFVVVLHAYGHYYCYPTWNESFQVVLVDIEPGEASKVLLDFIWPEEASTGENLEFYAAPLDRDLSDLVCDPGYVAFGWRP